MEDDDEIYNINDAELEAIIARHRASQKSHASLAASSIKQEGNNRLYIPALVSGGVTRQGEEAPAAGSSAERKRKPEGEQLTPLPSSTSNTRPRITPPVPVPAIASAPATVPPSISPPAQINPSYVSRQHTCFKCQNKIQVYSWLGHSWMQTTTPPQPQPATIKFKFSKQANGSYWINTCPYCKVVQGDNYVYEPDGPLPFKLRGGYN